MKVSSRMATWRATTLQGTPDLKSLAKGLYKPQAGLWICPVFGHYMKSQHPQCSFQAQILALPDYFCH